MRVDTAWYEQFREEIAGLQHFVELYKAGYLSGRQVGTRPMPQQIARVNSMIASLKAALPKV